jgi:hypothetical protein
MNAKWKSLPELKIGTITCREHDKPGAEHVVVMDDSRMRIPIVNRSVLSGTDPNAPGK